MPAVLRRSDWVPMAYALMSSHVHWLLIAGEKPSATFIQPLHVGFARWLNRRSGGLGPVFADRHRSVTCTAGTAARTRAYIHNNPGARDSWRARWSRLGPVTDFTRIDPTPPLWLDVERGLRSAGFDSSIAGRRAFVSFVAARARDSKSVALSAGDLEARRSASRAAAGNPVEVAAPVVDFRSGDFESVAAVIVPASCPARIKWHGTASDVLGFIVGTTGIGLDAVRSRTRIRSVTAARRLALLVWAQLARPSVEMALALGIGSSAACGLVARASDGDRRRALQIAMTIANE